MSLILQLPGTLHIPLQGFTVTDGEDLIKSRFSNLGVTKVDPGLLQGNNFGSNYSMKAHRANSNMKKPFLKLQTTGH
jgi:hypothetical protein